MTPDLLLRSALPPAPPRPAEASPRSHDDAAAPVRATEEPPMLANPTLRLDPALGIVVMEFRSGSGMPARSIPTETELAAYRAAAVSGAPRPGEPPEPRE